MNIVLTPRELEVGRHALGFNGRQKESFRNYFLAGIGHDDFRVWQGLVEKGLAKDYGEQKATRGAHMFCLNRMGALLCLKYGEKLERNWFDPIKLIKEKDQ